MTTEPEMLRTGEWIADYEIVARLRSGGMATVFLGKRHGVAGFSRRAAIKVIHPHLATDEQFVAMFVDEARICAQISHPNVVHVEQFGEQNGLHYLVMEYVDGCSVNQLLGHYAAEGKRLSPIIAARIIMQVAGGLHGAHEARGEDHQPLNIVHRDVTPSNILLSRDGHIKLIDFGIARARGRLTQTMTGYSLKGKLRYMAPEQENGKRALDRRCDIYSLGVVFWEMLTWTHLFDADDEIELLDQRRTLTIPPPSSINPEVPAALDAIVMAMLARDPDDRPATAWEARRRIVEAMPEILKVDSVDLGDHIAEILAKAPPATAAGDSSPRPLLPNTAPNPMGPSTPLSARPRSTMTMPVVRPPSDPGPTIEITPSTSSPRLLAPERPSNSALPAAPESSTNRWAKPIAIGGAGLALMFTIMLVASRKSSAPAPSTTPVPAASAPAPALAPPSVAPTPAQPVPPPSPPTLVPPAPPVEDVVVDVKPAPQPDRIVVRRTRAPVARQSPPAAERPTAHPSTPMIDGKIIATSPDDDEGIAIKKPASARTVGKTTIADNFDE